MINSHTPVRIEVIRDRYRYREREIEKFCLKDAMDD